MNRPGPGLWSAAARGPGRPACRVENVAADGAELFIYDFIDAWADEFWGGVSAQMVVDALRGVQVSTLTVRLNSPGGDYFEGVAIYNALRNHAAQVVVQVDGLAASAASVIAMAGDRLVMGRGTQLMIHNARTLAMGTAPDLRATADLLAKIDGDIAEFYAAKSGRADLAAWRAAMDAETWYTAAEALAAGLADEIAAAAATDPGDEPADGPAAARAAARWVAQWQHAGRDRAPAPTTTPAPAAVEPAPEPVLDEDGGWSADDLDQIRTAMRKVAAR